MSANTEDIAPQPGLYSEYAVNIADGLRSAFTALDMPGYIVRIHKRRRKSSGRYQRLETACSYYSAVYDNRYQCS
jgi:hypothetical protein